MVKYPVMIENLLYINREIERMCLYDVTVAGIDVALVLNEKLGVQLQRLYQSANAQQPILAKPINCHGVSLIAPKDGDKVAFQSGEESDMTRSL